MSECHQGRSTPRSNPDPRKQTEKCFQRAVLHGPSATTQGTQRAERVSGTQSCGQGDLEVQGPDKGQGREAVSIRVVKRIVENGMLTGS